MQSFVALLLCESVDRSTFCVKHVSVSYENVFLSTLLQPHNTANIANIAKYN